MNFKLIIYANLVLAFLAVLLRGVDVYLDRRSLLGSRCKERDVVGVKDTLLYTSQPVMPDTVFIELAKNYRIEIWFEYYRYSDGWHTYPRVLVGIDNGRVTFCHIENNQPQL